MKKNGVMSEVALSKNKKYKYSPVGDLVEFTGDPGVNEITVSGSKSSLRRVADMERNISILATQLTTTDGGTSLTPAIAQSNAAADATTKANAALAAAKSYADASEADAESAASSDATSKANAAKSQAISAASSDATGKANNAKSQAISAASSDATGKANAAKSQAISVASADATTKANNAKAQAISAVLGGAGQAYDTLQEIKTLMDAGDASLQSVIGGLPSAGNGTVSVAGGTGISTGGSFSMNQGHSETITISHSDTSSQSSVNNGGRTYIQDITLDSMGHITGISSASETVVNTDTNTWRPISDSVVSSSTSTSASLKAVKAAYDRSWPNTHRGISSSTGSTSTTISASSAAVKAAYDRSWPDTNTHRGISDSVTSTSTTISASSKAVKAAYDRSWPNTTYSVGDGGLSQINFTSGDHSKLNGIESGATADQSAAQLLASLKTVDGNGTGGLNAGTVDGLTLNGTTNNAANKVVRTDANGYANFGWINTASGASTSAPARIYASNDSYLRYMTPASLAPYILNQGSTKNSHTHAYLPTSGGNVSNNITFGSNYGHGVTGLYSATKFQQVYSMGAAYTLDDNGVAPGNFYGIAWTHSNNTNANGRKIAGHHAAYMSSGTTRSAIGDSIWTSGNVTAYSDERVKENLEIIPDALDKVCQLNGYTYDRTDLTPATPEEVPTVYAHNPTDRHVGVIAQEVLKVLPEAVTGGPNSTPGSEDDHYSVAYGNIVALLIEAVKELKAEIDVLKSK